MKFTFSIDDTDPKARSIINFRTPDLVFNNQVFIKIAT